MSAVTYLLCSRCDVQPLLTLFSISTRLLVTLGLLPCTEVLFSWGRCIGGSQRGRCAGARNTAALPPCPGAVRHRVGAGPTEAAGRQSGPSGRAEGRAVSVLRVQI